MLGLVCTAPRRRRLQIYFFGQKADHRLLWMPTTILRFGSSGKDALTALRCVLCFLMLDFFHCRSLNEVEAARERVAALLSGQLHFSHASLPPRSPKRAFLAGALLPFSGIACSARVPSSHHKADHEQTWDFFVWPPACATPPRLSADSTPDSAVHLLLDDGRQWHRLALSLSTLATVLDLLRPLSTLSPVEDWLKGCLSVHEPSSSVPTSEDGAEAESSRHQRRDLYSKIFGGQSSSSSATLEHILRVALLHSRVSTGQPDRELPGLPLLAEHSSAPGHHDDGGDALSSASHSTRPLLLSADEWSQFVAALSFGLSRAFDDLQVSRLSRARFVFWLHLMLMVVCSQVGVPQPAGRCGWSLLVDRAVRASASLPRLTCTYLAFLI